MCPCVSYYVCECVGVYESDGVCAPVQPVSSVWWSPELSFWWAEPARSVLHLGNNNELVWEKANKVLCSVKEPGSAPELAQIGFWWQQVGVVLGVSVSLWFWSQWWVRKWQNIRREKENRVESYRLWLTVYERKPEPCCRKRLQQTIRANGLDCAQQNPPRITGFC